MPINSLRKATNAYEAMLYRQGLQYASTTEMLWIYSMGKRFQVRAITTTDDLSNRFMEAHPDTALIACFGPFQIIASIYPGKTKEMSHEEHVAFTNQKLELAKEII